MSLWKKSSARKTKSQKVKEGGMFCLGPELTDQVEMLCFIASHRIVRVCMYGFDSTWESKNKRTNRQTLRHSSVPPTKRSNALWNANRDKNKCLQKASNCPMIEVTIYQLFDGCAELQTERLRQQSDRLHYARRTNAFDGTRLHNEIKPLPSHAELGEPLNRKSHSVRSIREGRVGDRGEGCSRSQLVTSTY